MGATETRLMRAPRVEIARRARSLVAATVLGGAVLVALGATTPVAAASHPTLATGHVVCHRVTGTITYSPALHHVGTKPETQKFVLHGSQCTTSGSNVHRVTGAILTATLHRPLDSCVEMLAPVSSATPLTVTWLPHTIARSQVTFAGFTYVLGTGDHVGFRVPAPGGAARVTGSFAGTDHGEHATATLYTNITALQFRDACLTAKGVAHQSIVSGSASVS